MTHTFQKGDRVAIAQGDGAGLLATIAGFTPEGLIAIRMAESLTAYSGMLQLVRPEWLEFIRRGHAQEAR